MICVRPVMRDHLSWATAFGGQKGWSPKTGSTVVLTTGNRGARWPSGLERWLGMATGQFWTGVEPHFGKNFSLRNFGNSVYPSLPVSFGWDTKSCWSLLSGVYARGSKRSHQSALECVTVMDSTSHSKPSRSASMRLKKLPCTDKRRRRRRLFQICMQEMLWWKWGFVSLWVYICSIPLVCWCHLC